MTVLLTVIFSALHLENNYFVTLYEGVDNFTDYFCTFYGRCTDLHCALVVDEQYFAELNSLALSRIFDVVNEELFALFCLKLLTVNFYNCVHLFIVKRLLREAICFVQMLVPASTE